MVFWKNAKSLSDHKDFCRKTTSFQFFSVFLENLISRILFEEVGFQQIIMVSLKSSVSFSLCSSSGTAVRAVHVAKNFFIFKIRMSHSCVSESIVRKNDSF